MKQQRNTTSLCIIRHGAHVRNKGKEIDLTNMKITKLRGEQCPQCKKIMQERKYKKITKKILKKAFYYSKWNFCQSCKFIKFNDADKIFNKNERGQLSKGMSERRQFNEFIRSI